MELTRRDLGRGTIASSAAQLVREASAQQSRWEPLVPGVTEPAAAERMEAPDTKPLKLAPANHFGPGAGIGIGHPFPPQPGEEVFDLYRSTGIEHSSVLGRLGEVNYDSMARLKDRMEERGIRLLNFNVIRLHCDPVIVHGLPGAEDKLRNYQQFLRDAGKAGPPYTTQANSMLMVDSL